MQSAKDTFLMTLRDRLGVVNPERTIAVRGSLRPAVLALENELPMADGDPMDCFVLTWLDEAVDGTEPLPLHAMQCEIRYGTQGTQELAGMDRGRVLSAMDEELAAMLLPRSAAKKDYSTGTPTVLQTEVFWSDATLHPASVASDGLRRNAVVQVFAIKEAEG